MPEEKKEQTKEYVVIKKNTLNYDVSDVVDLTEKEAKTLINKVRLKDQHDSQLKGSKEFSVLNKDLAFAKKAIEKLQGEHNELIAKYDSLNKELDAAKKSISAVENTKNTKVGK